MSSRGGMSHGIRWALTGVLLLGATSVRAGELYVSPAGTPGARGTLADPIDLRTALNDAARVGAGDTVWLMGGTYVGPFVKASRPSGLSGLPIVYGAMPGERVTITAPDNALSALTLRDVDHVWIWGLEVTLGGRAEFGYIPSAALYIEGGRESKVINCVVHDTPNRSGIGSFASLGGEYYGNIVFRNGLYANQLGHGIYSQNRPDVAGYDLDRLPWMEHRENVLFDNFGTGQHSYGSAPQLAKMLFEGTVSYGNGLPVGSTLPVLNIIAGGLQYDDLFVLRECFTYFPAAGNVKRGVDLGYQGGVNGRLTVERCVFIGGFESLWLRGWEQLTVRENTLYTSRGNAIVLERPPGFDPTQSDVDFNTYHDVPGTFTFRVGSSQSDTLAAWTAATGGFDVNGTVIPGRPSDPLIVLRPNAYDPERAHLIVYNWPRTPWVEIDLGALWDEMPGNAYRILPVADVWGRPVAEGVALAGETMRVPMVGPYAPEFAVYLILVDRNLVPVDPQNPRRRPR